MREPAAIGAVHAFPGQTLNLLAGQFWFGNSASAVKTLLGSCVAITLWHPKRHIGGMCHYLLPQRARAIGQPLDGRFGDEALELLVSALRRAGTQPQEYEAHLYGGADTMPGHVAVKFNVGERNIEQGWSLIDKYGFALQGIDVGDHVPRHVQLTLATGEVRMRRGDSARSAA